MIRVVVRTQDAAMAVNVGGDAHAHVTVRTFDVDAPELEAHLRSGGAYTERGIVGIEVLNPSHDRAATLAELNEEGLSP